jgi:predicted RNA-binding Zn-ribbon protein involved in translation (DUF1610 family)
VNQPEPESPSIDARIFHSQKYSLQKKNSSGFFVRVATFEEPVSQDSVLGEFGVGYYILRSTKPRFSTVWKGWVGTRPEEVLIQSKTVQLSIQKLERKTDNLAVGVVGLGVGTAVGWGLTAWNFVGHGERLNRLESAAEAQIRNNSSLLFQCGTCGQSIDDVFVNFCGRCGGKVVWPDQRMRAQPSEQQCVNCQSPIRPGQFFCTNCQSTSIHTS